LNLLVLTLKDIFLIFLFRPKPRWYVNFADFANMVKAFIGSNYLYVAYAFSQVGLWVSFPFSVACYIETLKKLKRDIENNV
jgi:hypothetical protein